MLSTDNKKLKTGASTILNTAKRVNGFKDRAIRRLAQGNYYTARAYYHYKLSRSIRHCKEPPLLVYQMGKVGSRTVTDALKAVNTSRPIYHLHFLRPEKIAQHKEFLKKCSAEIDHGAFNYIWLSEYILKQLNKGLRGRKWKIVTLVRDPIARNIAAFFELITVEPSGEDRQCKVKSDWYNFGITLKGNNVEKLIRIFIEKFDHDRCLKYFDIEFKDVLGIDLYASDFPRSKGYKIYEEKQIDILLIKLEMLNKCVSEAFKEFMNTDNLTLVNKNIGSQKDYGDIYKTFKDNIALPEAYIEKCYSSKFARHFYSQAEIEGFRRKWSVKSAPESDNSFTRS